MKNMFFVLSLAVALQAAAQAPCFLPLEKGKTTLKDWVCKSNTRLAEQPDGGIAMVMRTNEFNYAWMQRGVKAFQLPDRALGLYGRFRAPKGMAGMLSLTFICQPGTVYFSSLAGSLSESAGDWEEFYVPLSAFRCTSREGKGISLPRRGIRTGDALEVGMNGPLPETPVVFDRLRLVGTNEEETLVRPLRRRALQRRLLPETACAATHPRLLMTPERLARIRAKVATLPETKAVYEDFLKEADQLLKSYPADHPEKGILQFEAHGEVNRHQWSGQLEGAVNRAAIPLETLAAAYRLTGDERYGRLAARGLVNLARAVDADTPILNKGFYYTRTFYVRALAFGYDWLWPLFTSEERLEVKTTLLGFVLSIHDDSWTMGWGSRPLGRVWNWNPGLASCAGLGMLALEGETRVGEKAILLDLRRHLRDYLQLGLDPDGCCHEGPAYLAYGIGAGPQFAECLREQGRGDLFEDTNFKLIAPWLVSELLPGGQRWNNLSDCNHPVNPAPVYSYACGRLARAPLPALKAAVYPDPEPLDAPKDYLWQFSERPGDQPIDEATAASLMGWAWKNIGRNVAGSSAPNELGYLLFYEPCPVAEDPARILPGLLHFRGRGLVVARTGYGPDDAYVSIEAGPHAAGHDQCDKGSFTFYAYGGDLAIDSGYGNDSDPAKSTSSGAHNMVLINGNGQPMHYHNNSNGHITGLRHAPDHDWVRVDASEAWNIHFDGELQPIPNPDPVQRAIRQFCFVRPGKDIPPYLVVYDDICKDGAPADYTWLWHIPSSLSFSFAKDRWSARPLQASASKILTTPHDKARGSARFIFTAPAAGKYSLMGLIAATGSEIGKSDSFYVKSKGRTSTWHFSVNDHSFHWDPVADLNADLPPFDLKKGERLEVEIQVREPEAALAKLALVPTGETLPPIVSGKLVQGAAVLSAEDALSVNGTLKLQDSLPQKQTDACLTVFPVVSDPAAVKASWFLTTTDGMHPRLEHTVHAVNPHFLMVLVPGRKGTPLPQVERNGEHGVTLHWPTATDTVIFSGREVFFSRNSH